MIRTEAKVVEIGLSNNWDDVRNLTVNRLKEAFQKHPSYFFTEHDVHSVLYNIAGEELQLHGIMTEITSDGHQVMLVHHEYPTPFRCDMKKYGFQLKDEKPYKRGHYDLVVLNPKFVRSHELDVVYGKDYKKFKSAMQNVEVEPLIWACEVIFFPGVKKLPENALKITKQDALKVKETLSYKVGRDIPFCKMGSVHVFASHTAEDTLDLKEKTTRLGQKLELEVTLTRALPKEN